VKSTADDLAEQMLRDGCTQEDTIQALVEQRMRWSDAALIVARAADAPLRAAEERAAEQWQARFDADRLTGTRCKLSDPPAASSAPTESKLVTASDREDTYPNADDRRQREVRDMQRAALQAETARLDALGMPFSRTRRQGEP
jgi:hypothetical protein